jgi:hypothetical protein
MRATSDDERETNGAPPAERSLERHGTRPPKRTLTRRRPRGNDGERPHRGRPNANVSRHPVGGTTSSVASLIANRQRRPRFRPTKSRRSSPGSRPSRRRCPRCRACSPRDSWRRTTMQRRQNPPIAC